MSFLDSAAIPLYDGSVMDMLSSMNDPTSDEGIKLPLFITQGFATIVGFLVMPMMYSQMILGLGNRDLLDNSAPTPVLSLLVALVVIVFMGANSIFIEWNASLSLPESLASFERWARTFEDRAQEITTFLTKFDSNGEFLVALIVIAVLPAIGEEFVFRGLIQNHLQVITKNVHLAVWISAILFSFFHMQFFGFVPRVFLGALFGYLYVWSGNLAYPIIAHFVNNGFTLLMMYLYNKGAVNFDIEATGSVSITTVLVSAGISALLLFLFKSYFKREETGYE
jgi:membrane protease YdiL (CAAX protease family)